MKSISPAQPRNEAAPADDAPISSITRGNLIVNVEPWGSDAGALESAMRELLAQPAAQQALSGARHRVLAVEWLEPDDEQRQPKPLRKFRALVYDYTHHRTLQFEGDLKKPAKLSVSETAEQPLPNDDEFDDAVARLAAHPDMAGFAAEPDTQFYRPMPPLSFRRLPDGRMERLVNVGVVSASAAGQPGLRRDIADGEHRIVSVSMADAATGKAGFAPWADIGDVHTAPERALADRDLCGFVNASQATTSRGTPGSARITVSKAGQIIWQFFVVRPAASAGRRGSGIELRCVDFKGKRVLQRACAPIVNVRYEADRCGPFRNWLWQEGLFTAVGRDAAPGFRLCSQPAKTLLESGTDAGDFRGVAVYVVGEEVVLVSELEVGWFRYVSMWRFGSDGALRPRFGVATVQNSCACNRHSHHCHWRFDFNVRGDANNFACEYNDPPLPEATGARWSQIKFETKRLRDPSRRRRWRVQSAAGPDAYDIVPGSHDGLADAFSQADAWFVRERPSEMDDGVTDTHGPARHIMAHLDRFVSGQPLDEAGLVVWYAAHFDHDVHSPTDEAEGHIMGPELLAVNW